MNFLGSAEESQTTEPEAPTVEAQQLPEEFSVISDLYYLLDQKMTKDIDVNQLVEGALKGMAMATDDPYTVYLNPEEAEAFDSELSGSFEGIGAEVVKDGDAVRIVAPIAGSPAEEAGLMTNDIILAVDGQSVANLNLQETVELIRGEKGTNVQLIIERNGESETIDIVRGEIPLDSVYFKVIEEKEPIAHIHLTSFSDTTYNELLKALRECEDQGIEKVIFDVRGNPGGLLIAALEVSNLFVPNGEPLMQSQTTDQEDPVIYEASEEYGSLKFEKPAVLLIDEGSASASEILAGALSSVDIPLVGTTTFGKGSIQTVQTLSNGGDIKYTVGEWLTAEGEQINDHGIQPDYEVAPHEATHYRLIDSQKTYQLGDQSAEIKNIKNILSTLGYSVTDSDVFDEEMKKAVIAFQDKYDLETSGQIKDETAQQLTQVLREFLAENDPQIEKAVELLLSDQKN